MCVSVGHGSCVTGLQTFCSQFASRFSQTIQALKKSFPGNFITKGSLISHKISKNKQDEARNRKTLKILRLVKRAL